MSTDRLPFISLTFIYLYLDQKKIKLEKTCLLIQQVRGLSNLI